MTNMTYAQAVEHLNKWLALPHDQPAEPDGHAVRIVLDRARQLESTAFTEPFRFLRTWVELPARKRERLPTKIILDALRVHGRGMAARVAAEEDAFAIGRELVEMRREVLGMRLLMLRWKLACLVSLAALVVIAGGIALYWASTL
jgi:hypothetical protein